MPKIIVIVHLLLKLL